ncbi:MAG: hypothetical protein U1F65_03925, partial [Verrucomicrobiota bacterium]
NAAVGIPASIATSFPWVNPAYEGWTALAPNIDYDILKKGLLSAYLNNGVSVYKCPADKVPSDNGDRVRSISMNGQMGHTSSGSPTFYTPPNYNDVAHAGAPGYKVFKKATEISGSFSPTMAFIFLDEHPGSINDGYFQTSMYSGNYPDLPASYHNNAGGFSFADGHVELHKWLDSSTIKLPIKGVSTQNTPVSGTSVDLLWLRDHTTVKN